MNRYHILAIGLPCLAACGTGPEDFARCQATLDISVCPDVVPVISWTPAGCPVNLLTVDEGPNPVWSLYNQELVNAIESPVQYGRAAGQGEAASPGPPPGGSTVVSGVRYVVRLQRIEHGLVTDAGEATFDYQPPASDRGARTQSSHAPESFPAKGRHRSRMRAMRSAGWSNSMLEATATTSPVDRSIANPNDPFQLCRVLSGIE